MRKTLLVLCLLLPGIALGQSLGELAKREKERREQNKTDGKAAVRVLTEEELPSQPDGEASSEDDIEFEGATSGRPSAPSGPRRSAEDLEDAEEDNEGDGFTIPERIPPDAPLDERLKIFNRMKQAYEREVRTIDATIAENDERIRQIDVRIGATSALGGGGLPVAPQTGAGAATTPMTGQEGPQLAGEKQRLTSLNASLGQRKSQLKADLQERGRVAGIPPGYLRF